MKKKILLGLLLSALLMSNQFIVMAYDSPMIQFDGNLSENFQFSSNPDSLTEKFSGMMPGESRSETFTIVNNDNREMKFFLNTQVLKDLGEDNKAIGAVYEITFEKDGEIFYKGTVGGENGSLVDLSGQRMGEDMLMATLNKGESCELRLTIGIDGDSMDNNYQDGIAQMQFSFSAQERQGTTSKPSYIEEFLKDPVKQTINYLSSVATGDKTNLFISIVGVFSSILLVCIFAIAKKQHNKEGNK